MPTTRGALLFDADGVVQHAPTLTSRIRSAAPDESFLAAVFAAEVPALTGAVRFADVVDRLIDDWSLEASPADLLAAWTAVEIDADVVASIAELRQRGHRCYLTTNQHDFRAAHMRDHLRYDEVFDGQFYSCELGVTKPAVEFFTEIAHQLDLAPENLIFFDDNPRNVDGARRAGLTAELFTPQTDLAAVVDRLS